MEKYVDLNVPDDTIGIQALRRIKSEGPARRQLGVVLQEASPSGPSFVWFDILQDGKKIGDMTNIIWSYRLKTNIGFALVASAAQPGQAVEVLKDGERMNGTLTTLPFM